MNLATLAEESLQRLGPRLAVDFEGEKLTNARIVEEARRLQRAFADLGLREGKFAVMMMVNHPLVYSVFQGIFRTGAAAVPVMYQSTPHELRHVLMDTKAEGVVTDSMVLFKVLEAVKGLDHVRWIAVRDGADDPSANPAIFSLEQLVADAPAAEGVATIDPHNAALVLYTSGTTGRPKGAVLTHDNLVAAAEAAAVASEYDSWDGPRRSISALPMAHMAGIAVLNSGYYLPKHLSESYAVQLQWFDPEAFMRRIVEHQCSMTVMVPAMLALIMNHPASKDHDLSCLKEVLCGAAPLPVEMAQAFMNRWGCRVREVYGMTENAATATICMGSEPYRPGSAGRPHGGAEIRIVDENDQPLPVGQVGEILTRGRTTMKGYLNDAEGTARALRGGWMHTGDVGYLDSDGWLYVIDRKKDMIIRGGENIFPAEVEAALLTHPSILEAAVVGAPDSVYGERVIAFISTDGAKLDEEDMLRYLGDRMSKFKLPSQVIVLPGLPRNGVGKVLRRELRDRAAKMDAPAS